MTCISSSFSLTRCIDLAPAKARPPVSSAVAGRFLAGALGLRAPAQSPEAIKKYKAQVDQAKGTSFVVTQHVVADGLVVAREAKRKEEAQKANLNAAAFDE